MSTGLKGLSEVVKAVLDDRESSGRNARPPATPDLSLVMSRGKRFESARRLSLFGLSKPVWEDLHLIVGCFCDIAEPLTALRDAWGVICFGGGLENRERSRQGGHPALGVPRPVIEPRYGVDCTPLTRPRRVNPLMRHLPEEGTGLPRGKVVSATAGQV
jgi:hypothetical protein